MSGHCRLESFEGLVNGTESHQHDKGDLWTIDKALCGLPLVCIKRHFNVILLAMVVEGSCSLVDLYTRVCDGHADVSFTTRVYTVIKIECYCTTWIMLTCLEIAMTSKICVEVIQDTSVRSHGANYTAAVCSLLYWVGIFWTARKKTLLNGCTSPASTHSSWV